MYICVDPVRIAGVLMFYAGEKAPRRRIDRFSFITSGPRLAAGGSGAIHWLPPMSISSPELGLIEMPELRRSLRSQEEIISSDERGAHRKW